MRGSFYAAKRSSRIFARSFYQFDQPFSWTHASMRQICQIWVHDRACADISIRITVVSERPRPSAVKTPSANCFNDSLFYETDRLIFAAIFGTVRCLSEGLRCSTPHTFGWPFGIRQNSKGRILSFDSCELAGNVGNGDKKNPFVSCTLLSTENNHSYFEKNFILKLKGL